MNSYELTFGLLVLTIVFFCLIYPILGIPLGALLGYKKWKVAIPVGIVWSVLPALGASIPAYVIHREHTPIMFDVLPCITTAFLFSIAAIISAVISALIKKQKQQKKRIAELEKQLALFQEQPPQALTPQDE